MKRITYLAAVSQLLSQNNTSMRFKLPILVVLLSGFSLSLSAQTPVDFTTMADANTYGTYSQKEVSPGVFAMWGGDVDGDGTVAYNGTAGGTSPGRLDLLNNIIGNGGNIFNSQTYTYGLSTAYNADGNHMFDMILDGNVTYNGTVAGETPGRLWLLNQVVGHPGNIFQSQTFTFTEQLP